MESFVASIAFVLFFLIPAIALSYQYGIIVGWAFFSLMVMLALVFYGTANLLNYFEEKDKDEENKRFSRFGSQNNQ